MNRKRWIIIGLLVAIGLLLMAGVAGLWAVRNVPAAYRLVYGNPADPTPISTLRPTFTVLLPTETLTPTPTQSPTATSEPPTRAPSSTEAAITVLPTEGLTAAASATPTAPPPTPTTTPSPQPPTATPQPPTPTPMPKPQWIVFETKRPNRSDYEIFVMAPDGSRLTNLSNGWADDVAPVWSPNGRRVAFVSLRDTAAGKWGLGPSSVYLMDFDPATGQRVGNAVRLTDQNTNDGWPTWSPNGQRIAFESDRSGNWEIWVLNVDGSGLTQLTDHPRDDRYPAWSPDGSTIAFTSDRSGNWEVWAMDANGGNPRNLTNAPSRDRYAMWSPKGAGPARIAFNTQRDGNQEIYVMNADGSNQRNVSQSPDTTEGLADWSPDAKRLVLYSDRPGNKDIFILNLGNGQWTNITNSPGSDEFCTWSP